MVLIGFLRMIQSILYDSAKAISPRVNPNILLNLFSDCANHHVTLYIL